MDLKDALKHYLADQRASLLFKLDGLSERELRLPRTPTGTNLLGIVKHCLNVEYGYFGPTFGRTFDEPGLVPFDAYDDDPQADWYATADESAIEVIELYRRVQAFCDQTIDELPLDGPGRVPWWGEHGEVTLGQILVHVIQELARHTGQADILREGVDGAVGYDSPGDNVPEGVDWPAYVARLTALADGFA